MLSSFVSDTGIEVPAVSAAQMREVDGDPGQAADRNLAQRHTDRLGIEIALLVEVLVETPSGEARVGHDLIDRDRIEAVAVEHDLGAADDSFPGALPVFRWIGHGTSRYEPTNCPRSEKYVLEHRVRPPPRDGDGPAVIPTPWLLGAKECRGPLAPFTSEQLRGLSNSPIAGRDARAHSLADAPRAERHVVGSGSRGLDVEARSNREPRLTQVKGPSGIGESKQLTNLEPVPTLDVREEQDLPIRRREPGDPPRQYGLGGPDRSCLPCRDAHAARASGRGSTDCEGPHGAFSRAASDDLVHPAAERNRRFERAEASENPPPRVVDDSLGDSLVSDQGGCITHHRRVVACGEREERLFVPGEQLAHDS